jgi:serine/threonine protein kinase
MFQIAQGMSYLYLQGIAHQDLNSLIILLKLQGKLDAFDFQTIAKVANLKSECHFDLKYPIGFVIFLNMNIGTHSCRVPKVFDPRDASDLFLALI